MLEKQLLEAQIMKPCRVKLIGLEGKPDSQTRSQSHRRHNRSKSADENTSPARGRLNVRPILKSQSKSEGREVYRKRSLRSSSHSK
jgi:hypothetical protein